MATITMTGAAAVGCRGEGCQAQRPWPLHHVRHRGGVFLRLCTSCVLKYHPGSFCTSCFAVLDGGGPSPSAPRAPPTSGAAAEDLAYCCKCPSVAHLACLPSPDLAAQFACPSCMNPDGFSYLPTIAGGVLDQKRPTMIDLKSAKVLLAAAKLAAASMIKADSAARIEAEKKVEVAVVARKRARDMLVSALRIKKDTSKIKIKDLNSLDQNKASGPIPEAISPRGTNQNSPRPGRIEGCKSLHSREREKWMRFHETAFMRRVSNQGSSSMNNKSERDPNSAEQSRVELKNSGKSKVSLPCNSKHGEKKRLHSDSVKESDEVILVDKANDPKRPRSTKAYSRNFYL